VDDRHAIEAMFRVEVLGRDGRPDQDGFIVEHRLVPAEDRLFDLSVDVRWSGDGPVERGVRIGLELDTDEAMPNWLIPGLFYGENRLIGCRPRFPRYERGTRDPGGMTCETWSFRADRSATPAIFGWSGGRMGMIAIDESSSIGPAGIGFEGSAERTAIWADFPYREEPIAYRGYDEPDDPEVLMHTWQAGEAVTLGVRIAIGEADRHAYAPHLRALHARSARSVAPWVSFEEAAKLSADGLLAWHYHPEHRALYETASFERELDGSAAGAGDRPHMHVGWVSGAPWAAQLLAWGRRIGSEAHAAAGLDVLDSIAENLTPSGTFWAEWTLERGWGSGWSPKGTIHANTIGQATLFFLRALAAEDEHALAHENWEAAVRSNLDAICARQREDGNLGTYHDAATGAVTEWDGAGALVWIAALLDAAARFGEDRYVDAATRAGAFYRRFVDDELIYGAPEDVHLAPTSEDGYNAVIAFMALHRATRDPEWLDVARRAADWTLTWRYTYDVAFDEHTILAQYNFATTGTDQASPVNQHLHHFGLICGPELVELSRRTGDDHYRLRAAEALAAWRQFVARHDGDFNAMRGMVTERFYQTDCFRAKGSLLPLSHAWTGGVLLFACLAALEDPDSYALPA
jgi:hypothetical protein